MATRPVHSHGAPVATPVAIIGMAALFPEARTLQEFWQNIVDKRDCITDVPPSRWSVDDYYDPDPAAPDKTYCKRGGFLPEIDFDPLEFGLPPNIPNILEVTDSSQLLSLVVAKQALVERVYGAGARIFVELGPGGTCTRLIDSILGGREHLAAAIDRRGVDDHGSLFRLLAKLVSHRVRLDLSALAPAAGPFT